MVLTRKFILTELRDFAFLIIGGFLMTALGLTCRNCVNSAKDFWIIGSFTAILWLLLWKGNSYLTDYVSSKISWLKTPMKRFIVGIVSTVVYTYAAISLMTFAYQFFSGYNFSRAGATSIMSIIITLIISLFMHCRAFLHHWRKTAIDAEKLQKESIAAKYESLKNQVNPHFLFNSFNALTNLVYEDQDKAAKFIKQLSNVYRYVLDTRDKELVSLEEEVGFLNAYMYLQKIRFGNKLQMDMQLTGVESMVAPLVLQMLFENAIKHNIVSEENPLTIKVFAADQYLIVQNNIQLKTVLQEESNGIGLENICKRYEFLTDRKVIIEQTETFTVKLPIIAASL
ncbi:sensor histidine kinase [Pseudochryseolinea flava]|uniref:Histidine kinase n=1 Tax=Pseudochryseolinea flava TaxID=2059302 RepID=A0A364XVE7_9BACT|nr:histidine kinase [Pseudochryseolinea flava]RAV98091.1 histidine kinase [Pseudochryseolinea flava]